VKGYTHLYIDFDGVICDSVAEAFVCSYCAFHHHSVAQIEEMEFPEGKRKLFYAYRPFIRSGQHLMLLQYCLTNNIVLTSQDDFERELRATSKERLQEWRSALYDVRNSIMEKHMPYYLSLHRFYEEFAPYLAQLAIRREVVILSTKKEYLITRLLAGSAIEWPQERIITSHTQSKIDIIKERHADEGVNKGRTVAFIDDHLPHILSITEGEQAGIECYLADWGYTLPVWRAERAYAHVDSESLVSLLSPFL